MLKKVILQIQDPVVLPFAFACVECTMKPGQFLCGVGLATQVCSLNLHSMYRTRH